MGLLSFPSPRPVASGRLPDVHGDGGGPVSCPVTRTDANLPLADWARLVAPVGPTRSATVDFDVAFQPIVDVATRRVFGHEALVRGPQGQPASTVLDRIDAHNQGWFDATMPGVALRRARALGLEGVVSLNFHPCTARKLAITPDRAVQGLQALGFAPAQLMIEVTEQAHCGCQHDLAALLDAFRRHGCRIAVDDYGAGHAGMGRLLSLRPDIVKLDMHLVRGIETDRTRRVMLGALVGAGRDLGFTLIAEGVETAAERDALADLGITLMQGWHFARPTFGAVPAVRWDPVADRRP